MVNPKSLLFQMYRYWPVIEALTRHSREWPAFEVSAILALIAHNAGGDESASADILRSLTGCDILQPIERTGHVQLNPLVLDFARGLLHEHELGLSSVLKARVEGIRDATAELHAGMTPLDSLQLRKGAGRLSELIRQISVQLEHDRHAIFEIAEQAKASDAAIPIRQRYQSVLEAYDQYVEPMNEMMDISRAGTFYPYLEQAEAALDAAVEAMNVQGALYIHQLQLRQTAYQVKELQRFGRVVAQQCAAILLPLRDELHQHNSLSSAVSLLLGRVRKRGLARGLGHSDVAAPLPVWGQERPRKVTVGDEIRELLAEALMYTPQPTAFPESTAFEIPPLPVVDEGAIKAHLAASLPVSNLLEWLKQHYPELPDEVLLGLYQDEVRDEHWSAIQHETQDSTDLQTVRVDYYAHRIQTL